MSINVTLEQLVEAGAHYGHQSKRWNPKMAEYLYGVRDGVHVFDLPKTLVKMEEALNVIEEASRNNKTILIIGTKKQAKEVVTKMSEEAGVYYISERWLGGTLTNFDQLLSSVRKLADLKDRFAKGAFAHLTKKERLLISRKIEKMEKTLSGIASLTKKPELMIIIDTKKEFGAVREAKIVGIQTVGVVDSNADPNEVDFPIPMNDDAVNSVSLIMTAIRDAILKGKGKEAAKPEKVKKEPKVKKAKKETKENVKN